MIKIRMNHDDVKTGTVIEARLSELPEDKRYGFLVDAFSDGRFTASFPELNCHYVIFKGEFRVIK